MKGFCDLVYDLTNNPLTFVEQQRIFLENFQKRMHFAWSTASSTSSSSSCDDIDEQLIELTSSSSTASD